MKADVLWTRYRYPGNLGATWRVLGNEAPMRQTGRAAAEELWRQLGAALSKYQGDVR